MSKEYKQVPNILTGKDLDYLKDIFGWNYNLYKIEEDALQFVEDKEISKLISKCNELFYKNMNTILNILENGDNFE